MNAKSKSHMLSGVWPVDHKLSERYTWRKPLTACYSNTQADPFEMANLAASDPHHTAITEWEGVLDDWHEHTLCMKIDQHVETH